MDVTRLKADLDRFYSALTSLEKRLGGTRKLLDCDAKTGWPTRGVYFFFETGEYRAGRITPELRAVRVGTHAISEGSSTSLWDRLKQHRGPGRPGEVRGGNHRGSIFRLHVGTALVRGDRYTGPASTWGVGSSAGPGLAVVEEPLERAVSAYIGDMPFLWLNADDEPSSASIRSYIERNSIALLSQGTKLDPPSPAWLGRWAKDARVRASGLWNVRHVEATYDRGFLAVLEALVRGEKPQLTERQLPMVAEPATLSIGGPPAGAVLALISCTKKKASRACRAADLYAPSTFFRLAHEYARRNASDIAILSAKHGLLRPSDVVEPYEQTLATASAAERQRWARDVHRQLLTAPEYMRSGTILWLAGESYRSELLPLVRGDRKECLIPMAGLPQGKQLEWLGAQLTGRGSVAPTQNASRRADPSVPALTIRPTVVPRPAASGERLVSKADQVRDYAFRIFVKQAHDRGARTVTIRAREVHDALRFSSRFPIVCSALSSQKFTSACALKLLRVEGPNPSSTTVFVFECL